MAPKPTEDNSITERFSKWGVFLLLGGLAGFALGMHARTLPEHEPYCPVIEEPEQTALV